MPRKKCRKCGCTEDRACLTAQGLGCRWSISDPSICSVCSGEDEAQCFDWPEGDDAPTGASAALLVVGLVAGVAGGVAGYAWGWHSKMDLVMETARAACGL